MLKWRAVTIRDGEGKQKVLVGRGCPQGGVLSPLLWLLVADSLIKTLNEQGYFTVGYADDLAILISGKHEHILCDIMQGALRSVERWCTENELSANPQKTEMVLFTNKRKTNVRLPSLFNSPIQMAQEVKYLGVTLDAKLRWEKHVKYKTDKACRALWQARAAIGATWGLSPRIVLWLYTAVIRPMLTYGALVWWPRTTLEVGKKQMYHIQRVACLSITGALRTTPTLAMEAALCLTPLDIFVKEVALRSAARLHSMGYLRDRSARCRHSRILEEARHVRPILGARLDRRPPEIILERPYRVLSGPEHNTDPSMYDITIYTDGSKKISGAGAGVYCQKPHLEIMIPLDEYCTVLQTEVTAIIHGAKELITQKIRNKRLLFLTDSLTAVKTLSKQKITSAIAQEAHNSLKELSLTNQVTISWIKGHNGNNGNEKADSLARKSAQVPYGPGPALPLDSAALDSIVKEISFEQLTDRWQNTTGCVQSRLFIDTPRLTRAKQLIQLPKAKLRTTIGILTGHCGLRKHLHRMGLANSPLCRKCETEEETVEHILCECPDLALNRGSLLGVEWPSLATIAGAPPLALTEFFTKSGLLGTE